MNEVVFLDTSPLGLICFPLHKTNLIRDMCLCWLDSLHGRTIVIPEIADYECRRELIRKSFTVSIARLDALKLAYTYLPLDTQMMIKAAELWADLRNRHLPTADDTALDGDVILAAQALVSDGGRGEVIVATKNPGHLTRMVPAANWWEIA
jgi:predicted nucleic acid-binding protein